MTSSQWQEAVRAKIPPFKQSSELSAITTAFKSYEARHTKANLSNLESKFDAWRAADAGGEATTLNSIADRLDAELFAIYGRPDRVIKPKAGGVGPRGYRFIPDPDHSPLLAADQHLPGLAASEIQKLNEAFARSKTACELARNEVIKIAARSSLSGQLTKVEQAYVDYFGAFAKAEGGVSPGKQRARAVLSNYITLVAAFANEPKVIDSRNTKTDWNTYGSCNRGRVTDGVQVWIGRLFFKSAEGGMNFQPDEKSKRFQTGANAGMSSSDIMRAYKTSSDFTLATFIHEFAHASFNAVDAPPVEHRPITGFEKTRLQVANRQGVATVSAEGLPDGWVWVLTPDLSKPNDDNYGKTPKNNVQASTPEKDKLLARAKPDVAIRNADNYGQFAREVICAKGG